MWHRSTVGRAVEFGSSSLGTGQLTYFRDRRFRLTLIQRPFTLIPMKSMRPMKRCVKDEFTNVRIRLPLSTPKGELTSVDWSLSKTSVSKRVQDSAVEGAWNTKFRL